MFFFSGGRRHTRWPRDWSSDVSSSDLLGDQASSYRRDRRPRAPAQALVAGQLLEQIDDLPAVAHEVPRGKIGAVESRGEVDAAGPAVDNRGDARVRWRRRIEPVPGLGGLKGGRGAEGGLQGCVHG